MYTRTLKHSSTFLSVLIIVGVIAFFPYVPTTHAQTTTSSESEAQLEADVAQLQAQLNTTESEKQTLQTAVQVLNLNVKKIAASITLTNAQIVSENTQVKNISSTLVTTSKSLTQAQSAVADSLEQLNMLDSEPIILTLLSGGSLSLIFNDEEALAAVRSDLENKTKDLSSLESNLKTSKSAAESNLATLAALKQNLNEQEQSIAIARTSQNQLLQETKDKESNYEALIAQKQGQETQFEQSLAQYEGELNLKVQPGTLPPEGPLLQWPLDSVTITQYFGNTPFATKNPAIYNGHGHDGIDLRAPPGTPVMAAANGVVLGTGNTDLTCPGASYGKWIFIEHDNGLSTIYAHLSVIGVTKGQQVSGGQVIGYSDTTGYATGPHLHFGVYATEGSEIGSWPTTNPRPACNGKIYTMPVAALQAYLNPLSYLPALPK